MTERLSDLCVCNHSRYYHDRGTLSHSGQVTEDACEECHCPGFLGRAR